MTAKNECEKSYFTSKSTKKSEQDSFRVRQLAEVLEILKRPVPVELEVYEED